MLWVAVLTFTSGWTNVFAQNTFDEVYTILQTNCAISSCHGGANALAYDLGTTPTESYNAIVNVDPLNPAALNKGHKLVDPGHPYNSFLLKKIGQSHDPYLEMEVAEGNPMPNNAAALAATDVELIRQWILAGAPQTGVVADTALIRRYYSGEGLPFDTIPAAPAAGQGFQVRLGPFFMDVDGSGQNEIEYLKKEHLNLPNDVEVTEVEAFLSTSSHHFLLFKFDDVAGANAEPDGLREVNFLNNATDGAKELQAAWQYDGAFQLPAKAAFYWDQSDWVDLNYHFRNYDPTKILAADLYLNVYTQPRGSGRVEMHAELVNNNFLVIPPGNHSETMTDTWGGDDREIWMISSHTHKYGTRFDIFERNSDGSKGPQIYDGNYNTDYTFNQGFYDWEHPAVRVFDSLYTVPQAGGLLIETDWNNTSNNFVFFGLTTDDEMQLVTYLYTNAGDTVTVATSEPTENVSGLTVYPNPARGATSLSYQLAKPAQVSVTLLDMMGREIARTRTKKENAGSHSMGINLEGLEDQLYLLRIQVDDRTLVRKVLVRN